MELLRKSIKIGISGIVYDSAPPIRVQNTKFICTNDLFLLDLADEERKGTL